MPLLENLGGEAGKGVLTGGGASVARASANGEEVPVRAKGVAEAARAMVREELHGGAELHVWSAGWGNNRRRLPPVRCSQRKTMAGESLCPASLAGTAGRLLVQEGRGDEALLFIWSDSKEASHRQRVTAGKAVAGMKQNSEEAGPNCARAKQGGWRFAT
jgi:hypothetical protein